MYPANASEIHRNLYIDIYIYIYNMGEEIGTTCESSCQTEMLDDVDANDISLQR